MNGKGDKPRPFTVSRDDFEDNWDRIFKVKTTNVDRTMWVHMCMVEGKHMVGVGEPCNWCDATEEEEE